MVTIRVRVFPGSKEERVEKGEVWKIWVREPPVEGRANEAVLRILRRYFRRVRLVRGAKSRLKVFEVEG